LFELIGVRLQVAVSCRLSSDAPRAVYGGRHSPSMTVAYLYPDGRDYEVPEPN
jgi:hypothetical protein